MNDDELIETQETVVEEVETVVEEAPKRKPRAAKKTEPKPKSEIDEVNDVLGELFSDVDVWWDKARTQLDGRSAREAWEAGDTEAVWKMVR